jgi:hypothetical protein
MRKRFRNQIGGERKKYDALIKDREQLIEMFNSKSKQIVDSRTAVADLVEKVKAGGDPSINDTLK